MGNMIEDARAFPFIGSPEVDLLLAQLPAYVQLVRARGADDTVTNEALLHFWYTHRNNDDVGAWHSFAIDMMVQFVTEACVVPWRAMPAAPL